VVNKSDVADSEILENLRRDLRHVVFVSALTGTGFAELMDALEQDLPTPAIEVDLVIGYEHSDLVAQVHREGEIESIEHGNTGTRIRARVDKQLASRLKIAAASSRRL
jgi:GTP-binding protein HflX